MYKYCWYEHVATTVNSQMVTWIHYLCWEKRLLIDVNRLAHSHRYKFPIELNRWHGNNLRCSLNVSCTSAYHQVHRHVNQTCRQNQNTSSMSKRRFNEEFLFVYVQGNNEIDYHAIMSRAAKMSIMHHWFTIKLKILKFVFKNKKVKKEVNI